MCICCETFNVQCCGSPSILYDATVTNHALLLFWQDLLKDTRKAQLDVNKIEVQCVFVRGGGGGGIGCVVCVCVVFFCVGGWGMGCVVCVVFFVWGGGGGGGGWGGVVCVCVFFCVCFSMTWCALNTQSVIYQGVYLFSLYWLEFFLAAKKRPESFAKVVNQQCKKIVKNCEICIQYFSLFLFLCFFPHISDVQ